MSSFNEQALKLQADMLEGDPWIAQAIREIEGTYGDVVSVRSKKKSLLKFGRISNSDSGVSNTIAVFQGDVINETFVTGNDIDYLVSSNDGDDQVISVEGQTVDSDGNMSFKAQEVTLTGQTPAQLETALFRIHRLKVKDGTYASPSTVPAGNVVGYASDGVTVDAGVVQTDAAVKIMIQAGKTQSEKAATAISSQDYWIVTQVAASASRGNSSTVTADIDVEYRSVGGVWLPLGLEMSVRTGGDQREFREFKPFRIIPANSDVKLVGIPNTDNATLSGGISGVLASIIS